MKNFVMFPVDEEEEQIEGRSEEERSSPSGHASIEEQIESAAKIKNKRSWW